MQMPTILVLIGAIAVACTGASAADGVSGRPPLRLQQRAAAGVAGKHEAAQRGSGSPSMEASAEIPFGAFDDEIGLADVSLLGLQRSVKVVRKARRATAAPAP
mmetsp:Transcript_75452/g.219173  ORF Transcript_75452/g.219173 Transcript_75452/m.219173 type:complete len:103 (-) Transcript_75452:159-467(-)